MSVHVFTGLCTALTHTCDEQELLTSAPGVSRAVKAPCLMAGATVVTVVIGDFTVSFTSLASFFEDNFIISSPPVPPRPWGEEGGPER